MARKKNPPPPSAPEPEVPNNTKKIIAEKEAAMETLAKAQSEASQIERAADDKLRAARAELAELKEAEFRKCAEVVIELLASEKGTALLDFLAPEHSLRTCSDRSIDSDGRCARCALLEAVRAEWWDLDVVIDFSIRRKYPS